MRRFWFSLLLTTLFVLTASAQDAPAKPMPSSAVPVTLGHSVVALTGPWKFHIGDSPQATGSKGPQWADPNFDDSQWETVDLTPKAGSFDPLGGFSDYVPGWTAKGHPGYAGYAWYRIRVRIAGADEPLAVMTPNSLDDAFQLFVNGDLTGSFGNFSRSSPALYTERTQRFLLPADAFRPRAAAQQGETAVIAFRFYMAPRTLLDPMSGGFHQPPGIGYGNAIDAAYHVATENAFRALGQAIVAAIWFLAFAILVLMLYLFDRAEIILMWPFWAALAVAAEAAAYAIGGTTEWLTVLQESILVAVLGPLVSGLWLMMFRAYFRLNDRKWLRTLIGIVVLWGILSHIPLETMLLNGHASHRALFADGINSFLRSAVLLFLCAWIGWLSWHRARRGNWALFLALLCFACYIGTDFLWLLHLPQRLFLFGAPVLFSTLCILAMTVFLSIAFLQRFRSSQRRQQAMEEDVAQAQQVQQVLIPEELPDVPGLTIESEYRPAREVGGDFFQIIPRLTDGSVLIVAGDVTGKGLQAGMLVALIVGIIRNETAHTFDPLTILNALNRTLCGRGHAHATCLAMRIEADGAATLANAGHLPPYLNGKELPMEGALPLGMIENAEFSAMRFQLQENDRLILMSDGVAEAQDAHGQLFGFERIQEMMKNPVTAAEVATAAQTFGQQDDISVLRIVRVANAATKESMEPALALV